MPQKLLKPENWLIFPRIALGELAPLDTLKRPLLSEKGRRSSFTNINNTTTTELLLGDFFILL